MGIIKAGVVIAGIPRLFAPSPPFLSHLCCSSKYMHPNSLHWQSLEFPRRCGWGEGLGKSSVLLQKYQPAGSILEGLFYILEWLRQKGQKLTQHYNRRWLFINLALVVGKVDKAIHRMNHFPADSAVRLVNNYPLDSYFIHIHPLNNWNLGGVRHWELNLSRTKKRTSQVVMGPLKLNSYNYGLSLHNTKSTTAFHVFGRRWSVQVYLTLKWKLWGKTYDWTPTRAYQGKRVNLPYRPHTSNLLCTFP